MPYFVYKIAPSVSKIVKNIEALDEFEKFKQAKNFVKDKREEATDEKGTVFKIIFADDKIQAEEKLQEHRAESIVREWEK